MTHWDTWARTQLDAIRAQGRWRELKIYDGDGVTGIVEGRRLISFAANDYLGLASHPQVRAAAHAAINRWGTGATASRLIVGTRPVHDDLEREIAAWQRTEHALVCPTGFSANLAVMSSLGVTGTTIFSDALNHASIIDGCRQSRATVQVYRHADVVHLGELLATVSGPKIVVTDSVFSMDGDMAPLQQIAQLCIRHQALLVIDEAHAVLGPELAQGEGLDVLRVGTLSKTLGAQGGWIAGSRSLIELLINRGRAFIFTTGLSPADAAAALAALRIYRSSEGEELRSRLRELIDTLLPGHPSPIIPLVLGEEAVAVAMAARLRDAGFWVPAIRPPTVPVGTARLRIALSALHTPQMVQRLQAVLPPIDLQKSVQHAAR